MPFVVTGVTPKDATYQLTWEMINDDIEISKSLVGFKRTMTSTTRWVSDRYAPNIEYGSREYIRHILELLKKKIDLAGINDETIHEFYNVYKIPKKSSNKMRTITAPNDELKNIQYDLLDLIKRIMPVNFHASAYGCVEGRDHISAVRYHQDKRSNWYLKLDFSDFFGSISYNFLIKQLSLVHPFSYILERSDDNELKTLFKEVIKIAFLDDKLPQGTPLSPILTNILMIPIDHHIRNKICVPRNIYYTRYVDDLCMSSKYSFKFKDIEKEIQDLIDEQHMPLKLNREKTHYGSRYGRNFILGVMLNQDNETTIGHEKMRVLKAKYFNFIADTLNGNAWAVSDAQELLGQIAYAKQVNKPSIENMCRKYNKRFSRDCLEVLKLVASGKWNR